MKTLGQMAYEAGLDELLNHGHFEKEDGEHSTPTWETIGDSKRKAWQASAASIEKCCSVMNWQPIETAPKDDTPIDIWQEGQRLTNYRRVDLGKGNIFYEGVKYGYTCVRNPPYWMPIPKDPEGEEA